MDNNLTNNNNSSDFNFDGKDALFHYTRTQIAIERILYYNQLLFNTLINSRDPIEYKANLIYPHGTTSGLNSIDTNKMDDIIRLDNMRLHHFKMVCFSINTENQKGYLKSSMWTHYAEGHSGICLVFSSTEFYKTVNSKIQGNDNKFGEKIKYMENEAIKERILEYQNIRVNQPELKNKLERHNEFLTHIKEKKILFIKHKEYEKESEYRVVFYDNTDREIYIPIKECIKGIILGEKFSEVYLPLINKYCNDFKIPVKKIFFDKGILELIDISKVMLDK